MLNQAEYRTIVEHAPMMIWRADVHAKCDYFNQRWLAFTGRSLEDQLGDGWSKGVHPDDYSRCLKTYLDAFQRREPFEMEYRLLNNDGEYRWIYDVGGPIFDTAGRFKGYIGSCVDVTDRVEARVALARANLKDLGIGT